MKQQYNFMKGRKGGYEFFLEAINISFIFTHSLCLIEKKKLHPKTKTEQKKANETRQQTFS